MGWTNPLTPVKDEEVTRQSTGTFLDFLGGDAAPTTPNFLRDIQTANIAYLAARNDPMLGKLDLGEFDEQAFDPRLRQLYQAVAPYSASVPSAAYAVGGPERLPGVVESGREFTPYEQQRQESYLSMVGLENAKMEIDMELADLESTYRFPEPYMGSIVTGGPLGLWTSLPSNKPPGLGLATAGTGSEDWRIQMLEQIPEDIQQRYYELRYQQSYIAAKGYKRGTLEAIGRTMDALGPMPIRHIIDESLRSFKDPERKFEWGRVGEDINNSLATTFLGTSPTGVETLSYIDTLNEYYYGSHQPAAHDPGFAEAQGTWARSAIIGVGIAGDVFLDPWWLVTAWTKGTKTVELTKIRPMLDDLARVFGRAPITPKELEEALNLERALALTGDLVYGVKGGRAVPVEITDEAIQAFMETQKAQQIAGTTRPVIGSDQWKMLVDAYEKYGTLYVPAAMSEQYRLGMRGILNVPMLRSTRTPSFWTRSYELGTPTTDANRLIESVGQVFQYGWHMEPIGGSLLEPAARYFEKLGITDGWTFMDQFLSSGLHAGGKDTRQLRRTMLGLRKQRQVEYQGARYSTTLNRMREDKALNKHLDEMWAYMDDTDRQVFGTLDDFKDDAIHNIMEAAERDRYLSTYSVSSEEVLTEPIVKTQRVPQQRLDFGAEGQIMPEGHVGAARAAGFTVRSERVGEFVDASGVLRHEGVPDETVWRITRRPTVEMPIIEGYNKRFFHTMQTNDPLINPGRPALFSDPIIRDYVQSIRDANKKFLVDEDADLLRVVRLFDGQRENTFDELVKMINSEDATAYVNHSTSPETMRWLVANDWMERTADGMRPSATFRNSLNPKSHTLRTRKWRGTVESFNEMMYEKYKGDYKDFPRHFWERNPAKTTAARAIESARRRISARFHLGFIDELRKVQDVDGNYVYRMDALGEVPEGFVRYSDAMGDSFKYFNEEGQLRLTSAIVPKEFAGMIREQAKLITNRQQLSGFLNYMERSTNNWKANTLAAWPAYHGGNMISNYYLNWIGGMQDSTKYGMAAKIQRGADGVAYSPWTGQTYEYSALREMAAAHGVTNGYFRSNMGDEMDRVRVMGENKGRNTITQSYYAIADEVKDITGSYGRSRSAAVGALTGWSVRPKDLIRTDYLFEKLWSPLGGTHAAINKVGFAVGSSIEENARMANFLDGILNKGMTVEQAASNVNRVLFNYAKDTTGKRIASTLLPFYEFPTYNTMLHLQLAATKPGRLSAPFRIVGRNQALADRQEVPEWKRNRMIVEIFGKIYDLSRYFPLIDFTEMRDVVQQVSERINPIIELMVSLGMNYDFFRERAIATKLESGDTTVPYSVPLLDVDVNANPYALFFFKSMYRAFGEFERFDSDPSWQTALGLRTLEYDRETNIRFDLVDARGALDAAKREYSIRQMPREDRPPYTPEQLLASQMQVARESMRVLTLLADQYVTGKNPFDGTPIPMYTGDSRLSKDGILSEMHQLLIGTANHPELGVYEIARQTEDASLEMWALSAVEENMQQRALLRLTMAADEFGDYIDGDAVERGTAGYEAYKESREVAARHYNTARGYVEDVMNLHGTDDVWKIAHFELYVRLLRERTDLLGFTESNFDDNFARFTEDNPEIHTMWKMWSGISDSMVDETTTSWIDLLGSTK